MNINATLIGQAISFALFVWFCMNYVWPPLSAALEERAKKIADGLDAASKAESDLEEAKAEVAQQLAETKAKAADIIEQANKRASQIVEEAKIDARSEGERIKAAAQADVDNQINQAREVLRSQVATLSVVGAEKILEKSVDQASHSDLLDKLASEL